MTETELLCEKSLVELFLKIIFNSLLKFIARFLHIEDLFLPESHWWCLI